MMYPMFTYNTDQGVIGIQAENNVLVKVTGTDNIDFDETMEAYSVERNRIKSVNEIVEI